MIIMTAIKLIIILLKYKTMGSPNYLLICQKHTIKPIISIEHIK